jgi:hypothetical protein
MVSLEKKQTKHKVSNGEKYAEEKEIKFSF